MMSAGGITIEDDVQIAANVQLISNNHGMENRHVITCKPVHICRRVRIGAGSVITHDIKPNIIVAGNPAKVILRIQGCLA